MDDTDAVDTDTKWIIWIFKLIYISYFVFESYTLQLKFLL